jgi:uncharacterized protein (TIGR03437 family)
MFSSTTSLPFKYSLRVSLLCLLTTYILLHPLPAHLHSSNRAVSFAPAFTTGPLGTPREGHTATLLQNGRVLVAGGRSGGTILDTAEIYDPVTASWRPTNNKLSNARHGHSAVLLRNGQVLVLGGQSSGGFLDTAEIYDPADNSWKALTRMTTPRFHHTATLLNNSQVLVAGGQNATGYLRSAELFNPATGVWTRLDSGNNPAGNLTEARAEHTATLLSDGRVLVTGGYNGASALKTTELFEPNTNRWRGAGAMLSPRRLHTATLLPDNIVLVAGGLNGATALNSSETYNPTTKTWTLTTGNLAQARRAHTATLLPNGGVFVAGGSDGVGNALNTAEVYDYTRRTWGSALLPASIQIFTLAEARSNHTATLLPNGQVLLAGGLRAGASLSSAELYEYATGFWSVTKNAAGATTELSVFRAGQTATLLPNGKVLVAGGQSLLGTAPSALNSAELYDPETGAWTATGALNQARFNHTATLLPNGKVLIVGGDAVSQVLNSAELYDPVSGVWTNTPAPVVARALHTATLLNNGLVLVAGGIGANGQRTPSTQLYDPNNGATGSWSFTQNLSQARSNHTATLLPDGTVFVFGGLATDNAALNSGALFVTAGAGGSWVNLSLVDSATSQVPDYRFRHRATLLANNKVFISGGRGGAAAADVNKVLGNSQIYNIGTRSFERGQATTAGRFDHTATLLPQGKVLLVGGRTISSSAPCETAPNPVAQLFDSFVTLGSATSVLAVNKPLQARNLHTATLLTTGDVLLAGGSAEQIAPNCANAPLKHSELYDAGLGFQEQWRPIISFLKTTGGIVTVNGAQFRGLSEAAGHGAQSSASNYPIAQLRSLGNEQMFFLPLNSTGGWSSNTFSFSLLPGFAPGPALLTIYANGIPSVARVVNNNGSEFNSPNATPQGTISGRVVLHNGEGIAATVAIAPEPGSPAGCNLRREITTSPDGEFVFGGLVIRPTPTPPPPTTQPSINCNGDRGVSCISTPSPNGCNVAFTNPPVSPAGTAVTCTPPSGAFFNAGVTTVVCRASNQAGTATCSFQVIYSFLTCPNDVTVQSPNGTPRPVNYPPPSVAPTNFSAQCSPPSGATFPIGTTTVTCVVKENPSDTCSFQVTVQSGSGLQDNRRQSRSTPPSLSCCGAAHVASFGATETVVTPNVVEQSQTTCRYRVTPSATIGNVKPSFFPASAVFTLIEEGSGFAVADKRVQRRAAPEQGGTTCENCTGNKFVAQAPFWTISGQVRTPGGTGVSDVDLEFSVPYEICDDLLTCQDNSGNPIKCNVPGAKTIVGDPCVKASDNPLDPAAEFHCACTKLRGDGTCEKTVLARYPSPAGGNFIVANRVPTGANALVIPSNRPGGADYTFTYQPPSPPGVLPLDYLQLDQVLQDYANQIITAQACVAPNATITPAPAQVCANSTGNTASVPDAGGGASYNWTISGGTITGGQGTRTITYTAGASGSVMLNVTVSTSVTCSANNSLSIPINAAPNVTAPPGAQAVCANSTATFTAAANGAPQVRWQVSTDGGSNFVDVPGANSTTLSFTASAAQNGARYRAVFTSVCGSVNTSAATLTVNTFALSTTSATFSAASNTSGVDLTATVGSCSWNATSNSAWLTITSGASGTGNGRVNFAVAANPDPAIRTGMLTIAGLTFTVTQSGAAIAAATNVSAASFVPIFGAAEAIIAVFGTELATQTLSATTLPLPTTLGGTTVTVRDSLGTVRNAPLFFVSPNQINYLIPVGTANGAATVTITAGNGKQSSGPLTIQTVAPGLFSASANGRGLPAAVGLRVKGDGQQINEPVIQYDAVQGRYVAVPIDLGPPEDRFFLIIFGTALRGRSSLGSVIATLGGVSVPVTYLGAQGQLVGLDQGNLGPLPRTLIGRGNVELNLMVDGQAANTLQVNIK